MPLVVLHVGIHQNDPGNVIKMLLLCDSCGMGPRNMRSNECSSHLWSVGRTLRNIAIDPSAMKSTDKELAKPEGDDSSGERARVGAFQQSTVA